ncbi:MAG: hypothetical protein JWN82_664 [Candidatus Saccharibacteria bacterium]|nr:hypothetical protein [Candidatus Saccharibacteria bacterium]
MQEQLVCNGCVLRTIGGDGLGLIVETLRARLDDSGDLQQIGKMEGAEEIKQALRLPRPERCARLAGMVVIPRELAGHRQFSRCPEVALAGQLVDPANNVDF